MWDRLVEQVGLLWIILVLMAAGVLLVLLAVFISGMSVMFRRTIKRLMAYDLALTDVAGCRIDNLEQTLALAGETMNPEFISRLKLIADDSQTLFDSLWVPPPETRLTLPEILPAAARQISSKKTGFALLLGGFAASTLALSTAFVRLGISQLVDEGTLLRFIAILPLVVGAIGLLVMYQLGENLTRAVQHSWQLLMVTLGRKLPVYSHSAETARLIFEMRQYDAHMAKSVSEVAGHVQALSAGKMTDAVSNAVKYVMAATVGPAVVKSTETLGILANQLEKQIQQVDLKVAKLYADLEIRQTKQSELWFKRYQEISEVLSFQQETMLKNVSASEQQLIESLGKSQKFALDKIVDEQSKALDQMTTISQKSWLLLQEKLTAIISQLSDGQSRLLGSLTEQQQQTLLQLTSLITDNTASQQVRYETLIENMQKAQTDLWQKSLSDQTTVYEKLQTGQDEAFNAISSQQRDSYEQVARSQQEGLQLMRDQQAEAIRQLGDSQSIVLQQIDKRQADNFLMVSQQQTEALNRITETQAGAIDDFRKAQFEALSESTRRQQETLQHLAENFGSEVSSKLAGYLDPISARLSDASEALIKAQSYAADVQDVLRMQNEAATSLQQSIGGLFEQLIETRATMSEDLRSMKTSSGVMSKAAEVMGSVYEGSQAGLSEAISQMSGDLMRLSDVLSAVMSGSAEQTRQMQTQSLEIYEANQKHLDAVRGQITMLSDELSTRIDQLMLGFSNLTGDLINNVNESINTQNDTLGGSLRSLTDVMSEEARSMSLFAQQINMDIETLNTNLRSAVSDFDSGMRGELSTVLSQFDSEVADIIKRLARSAAELGDAVDALPEAIRKVGQTGG